ncbi:MAG TPA: carboxypeptidase regulatory-like domain-containing protein [Acidobacteriaceae bacterium]|nr:carboxypeptidase regulatory-like domain-containing protein [Acidobacteriaceae bacterium]
MPATPRILTTHLIAAATLCLAQLLAASHAHAQDPLRHLTGTVTDPHREPLAGAVVQLHDDSTDAVTSYITDRTGRYRFFRVSPEDDFHLWATFRDHKSRSKSISKFDSKPDRTIRLIIKLN